MARIPVERDRKGSPWWLWLLGLALIGLLAWLLIGLFDPAETEQDIVEGETPAVVDTPPTTGILIIDPIEIEGATEPAGFVGRQVQLDSMYVESVPGDSVFVVSRSPGSGAAAPGATASNVPISGRVLVVLDENIPAPPDSVEGGVNVEPGQTVRIDGEVRQLDDQVRQRLNLPGLDLSTIAQNGLYVRARSATVSERP